VNKIKRNQERDQHNYQLLYNNGWQVIVVWECQLTPKRIEQTMNKVELQLNNNLLSLYSKHTPVGYNQEAERPLPMAAEENEYQPNSK
jgi:DNA mismatch endonuclease (patch repair protein)